MKLFLFGAPGVCWCALGFGIFLAREKLLFLYCFLWLLIN